MDLVSNCNWIKLDTLKIFVLPIFSHLIMYSITVFRNLVNLMPAYFLRDLELNSIRNLVILNQAGR